MTARIDIPKPVVCPILGTRADHRATATTWIYDYDDAHAVKVVFRTPRLTWTFARTLLVDLTTPAGHVDADVMLVPLDDESTLLRLHSPDGVAVIRFPTDEIRAFRNRTYAVCPLGSEPAPDLSSVENVLRAAAEATGGDW